MSEPVVDNLKSDAPIRGQNFVCLSFVSPENVLKNKEIFFFEKYTERFQQEARAMIADMERELPEKSFKIKGLKERFQHFLSEDSLMGDYRFFKTQNEAQLTSEFDAKNGFQTSVRGLKVRGSYESKQEAMDRADQLHKTDRVHSVYVAEVGAWCPWDPSPDAVGDSRYAEDSLNTLMQVYNDDRAVAEVHHEYRQMKLREEAAAAAAAAKALEEEGQTTTDDAAPEAASASDTAASTSASASDAASAAAEAATTLEITSQLEGKSGWEQAKGVY